MTTCFRSIPFARFLAAGLVMLLANACASGRYTDLGTGDPSAPYVLSSGDKLRVLVFGQDNLSNIYAVDGSGQIAMPLIGTVRAAGLTTSALEKDVARRLRSGFVREPDVSVEVSQYRPFYVLGEVTQSGQYPYVSGMTAQNAIAIAGGFTPRAVQDGVEVSRQREGGLVTGWVPLAYPLKPGDTVLVKERWF
jgi:polysaccharide export outer membrane protein